MGLPKLTTRRIRFAVSRASGGSSGAVQYALQMAETATCSAGTYALVPNTATDRWQVVGSTFIADGEATSNITPGLTDDETTFIAGELKDASNTTGNITLTNGDFTEIEFSVQATGLATDGGDYCFRLYDATNVQVLDAYTVYAEVQLAGTQDVTVSASGTQTASMAIPNINRYVGGKFVISTSSGFRNVTGITVSEGGTVNAQGDLNDIELFWELDTTGPYDGASESYGGTEAQFGVTDTNGFSAANGSSSFTDSVPISPTSSLVVYVLFNVLPTASAGETIEINIDDPPTDVSVSAGVIGPGSPVAIPGTTTLAAADGLTQYHYRWRNDDGGEGGTGGTVVDRQVAADSDDAEERVSSGNMTLGSNLEMVDNEGSLQEVGYRFQNITVPNSAAISNAYIQFTVDDTDSGAVSLTVHGEAIGNAPTFTTGNSNISNRTTTGASVLWSGIPNWTTSGARGPDQRTPDLTSIVQEIVSGGGWNSGQAMVFIFTGSGVRTAVAHDSDPTEAALLHIEHSGGGGGATWGAPEDTKLMGVVKSTVQRVRFEISNEGVAGSGPVTYELQVAEGVSCTVGSYTMVPTAATGHWQIVDSTFFADGAPTTNLAPGLTDEATTFVPGEIKDAGNTTGSITLNPDEHTEIEFSLQATANAIDGQDYCFRLYNATGGSVLDTYSIYAEAQLAGGTLTLANHDAGQETDKFTTITPVTAELFAFKLTRVGTATVSDLSVSFTTGGGVASVDVTASQAHS